MASKMSALMDLVAQNQPTFQTHRALLVIGMQNDFLLPDGRLPVNVRKGFLERIQILIPKFRQLNGNVIWVQTLYEADRIASDPDTGEGDALVVGGLIEGEESSTEGGDEELTPIKDAKDAPPAQSRSSKHKQRALDLLKRVSARRKTIPQEVAKATAEGDDELFLLKSEKKTPACVPNTLGAEFADVVARQFELPADSVIRTTNYSAFQGTNLLMTLRARLVTELYICGCITNISVLATVIDAARHGVKINVIQDCLGYRKRTRHELALKRMDEFFDAYLVNSGEILDKEPPAIKDPPSIPPNGSRSGSKGNDTSVEAEVAKKSLVDEAPQTSRTSSSRSPTTKVLSGKQRALSLVSIAESRKVNQSSDSTVNPIVEPKAEPSIQDFSDMLVKGATVPGAQEAESEEEKLSLVKTKIRMRSKEKRKKRREREREEAASKEKAAAESCASVTATPLADLPASSAASKVPPSPPVPDPQRPSWIAKAGSVMDLREKENKSKPLKSAASVPVLSSKNEEKDRYRLSDLSDRMRLSLSRAPKSESGESRKGPGSTSAKTVTSKASGKVTEDKLVQSVVMSGETGAAASHIATTPTSQRLDTTTEAPPPVQTPTTPTMVVATPKPSAKASKIPSLATLPVLGPHDTIGEGDSSIIYDFFPPSLDNPYSALKPLKDSIFTDLYNEVQWQKMLHHQGEVPRLVCCQGACADDGSMPIYRHPSDHTLPLLHFSPKVNVVRKQAEKVVGHPLNHVLIQLYRSGSDYISEHSDKTLDIVKDSTIVNVSFGAQRTMRLRTKKSSTTTPSKTDSTTTLSTTTDEPNKRTTQRIPLPHNSLFKLGLATNAKYLHGIMPDKRLDIERSPAELDYGGMRISLTFRHIGTFIDANETTIWGQGATTKEQRDAADVINGDDLESEKLIRTFGLENQSAEFDWDESYGAGSDVLHLNNIPEYAGVSMLFLSHNEVENLQVEIYLTESKIKHTTIPLPVVDCDKQWQEGHGKKKMMYRDTDTHHTEVYTASSILLYLDRYYGIDTTAQGKICTGRAYGILSAAEDLLKAWETHNARAVRTHLSVLEEQLDAHADPFIAGKRFSVADAAVWPIIDTLVVHSASKNEIHSARDVAAPEGDDKREEEAAAWRLWDSTMYPCLTDYHATTLRKKGCVRKVRERGVAMKESDKYKDKKGEGEEKEERKNSGARKDTINEDAGPEE